MSTHSESILGIWLNTSITFLNANPSKELRFAKNDSNWFATTSASGYRLDKCVDSKNNLPNPLPAEAPDSLEAIKKLHQDPSRTLYAYVKYGVVTQWVESHHFETNGYSATDKLVTVDLGCSFQPLRRYLTSRVKAIQYVGIDCVQALYPDILCDLSDLKSVQAIPELRPDVVIGLDILAELHDNAYDLNATLHQWSRQFDGKNTAFVVTIPNRSRNENHKLSLSTEEWMARLSQQFNIVDVLGLGFLSALPYLVSEDPNTQGQSVLRKILNVLKEPMFNSQILKSTDLLLTQILGKSRFFKRFAHSMLIIAEPKAPD